MFEFLTNLRFQKGLDLDSLLILSAFNIAGLSQFRGSSEFVEPLADGKFSAELSATAISDMTGIPRQTVRRRLTMLEERGYLVAAGKGGFAMNDLWHGLFLDRD